MGGSDLESDLRDAADFLRNFLAKRLTGNVTFNIKDGQILGIHMKEYLSLGPTHSHGATNPTPRP